MVNVYKVPFHLLNDQNYYYYFYYYYFDNDDDEWWTSRFLYGILLYCEAVDVIASGVIFVSQIYKNLWYKSIQIMIKIYGKTHNIHE